MNFNLSSFVRVRRTESAGLNVSCRAVPFGARLKIPCSIGDRDSTISPAVFRVGFPTRQGHGGALGQ